MSAEKYTRRIGSGRSSLVVGGGIAAILAVGLIAMLRSKGPTIEVIHPKRGEIRESFREPAKTRLENTWTVTAQVTGRIGRIDLEPGDAVGKGQVLAVYDRLPLQSALDEAEARVEQLKAQLKLIEDASVETADLKAAEARASSSTERIKSAEAQIDAVKARVLRTQKDLARAKDLVDAGALDPQTLDAQQMAATEAQESLKQAEADLEAQRGVAEADKATAVMIEKRIGRKALERKQTQASLEQAEAQMAAAQHDLDLAEVISPIDGTVLERYERGEKPVTSGTPLLLLGNPEDIEVIADVLTEDALKLKPGDEVSLEALSGEELFSGAVKRIEPQGFTKLSSLGVEQQRVNVIVSLPGTSADVGVGYRLYARFFTGTQKGVLIVPRYTVLQSPDQTNYVYVVEDAKVRRRNVRPGLKSDLAVEITKGLAEADMVVSSPDATLEEGSAVSPREIPFQ